MPIICRQPWFSITSIQITSGPDFCYLDVLLFLWFHGPSLVHYFFSFLFSFFFSLLQCGFQFSCPRNILFHILFILISLVYDETTQSYSVHMCDIRLVIPSNYSALLPLNIAWPLNIWTLAIKVTRCNKHNRAYRHSPCISMGIMYCFELLCSAMVLVSPIIYYYTPP